MTAPYTATITTSDLNTAILGIDSWEITSNGDLVLHEPDAIRVLNREAWAELTVRITPEKA